MPRAAQSAPKVNQARRHFLAAAAAAGTRVAAIGVLGSTALLSSAQAKNNKGKSDPSCFLRGTAILTPTGEVPVEDLQVGDLVETVRGTALPIKWIGRQIYRKSGSAWPESVMPIRVARGALDENTPHTDLYLSPLHALLVDGLLIEVKELVNGASIAPALPAGLKEIEYFNILLDSHEAILAEGAPAETLLPAGMSPEGFSNFIEYERLYPGEPWPMLVPLAPVVSYTGRRHLKALLRLGMSHFIQVQDPVGDAYENAYERLAARAEELVS